MPPKLLFLFFITFFLFSEVQAFDKIRCLSSLNNWYLVNQNQPKKILLDALPTDVQLSRKDSDTLIINNEKGIPIASIIPWNGVIFLPSKSANKAKYKFEFKTDDSTYFQLSILDSAGKNKKELTCNFSF
jgi:hypothetical protein